MSPVGSMATGVQSNKPRSGMEMPANIQPKAPSSMRPTLLPSMTTSQIRPGASVSTQTATGQTIPNAQMGTPRSQVNFFYSANYFIFIMKKYVFPSN